MMIMCDQRSGTCHVTVARRSAFCFVPLILLPASCMNFDFAAVVHPMSHTVGSQQQSLNASSGTSGAQIINPAQGQSADTFYGTTTPPQDINQSPTVDALAASLGT